MCSQSTANFAIAFLSLKIFFLEIFQSIKEAAQMRYLCAFRREQMEKRVEYVKRQLCFLLILSYFVLYLPTKTTKL